MGVNLVEEQAVKGINSHEILFYKIIILDCPPFCYTSATDRSRRPEWKGLFSDQTGVVCNVSSGHFHYKAVILN